MASIRPTFSESRDLFVDSSVATVSEVDTSTQRTEIEVQSPSSQSSISLQSRGMSALQMFECLKEHGCPDLTSAVDPNQFSSGMILGGSFGDIWTGRLYDGTNVAIKVWRFTSMAQGGEKSIKRGMRELYNWSKMNHENVHKLLGVIMFQGRLGMVSEWMENGDLRSYLAKNENVDRYQLCVQVASGMHYLHSENIVHGDLKASNILVSSEGVIKITDFDHSLMSGGSIMFTDTTRIGGGTLRWMAPELVLDTLSQRSKQTDVYALGMTLLEIITGEVPYYPQCRIDAHVIVKLSQKALPDRTDHFSNNMSGDRMWELLVQCWDHDPAARPPADKVLDSLRRLISPSAIVFQSRGASPFDMFECLKEHGCPDLTSFIDPHWFSSGVIIAGSIGDIWKGRSYDRTEVAIKVWRFTSVVKHNEKGFKRSMREIYHWSKMNHENIHKLLGVIAFQGRLGMVSGWMENGNLRQCLDKNMAVDRYRLCTQVANGVRYLHSKNMVHGDIKASNILVSSEGVPKLAGFSRSIMSDCSLMFTETTRIGGGTLRWMAPELVLDTSYRSSNRTDVYALGMTLLEIVTGIVPYYPQCRTDVHVVVALTQKRLPNRTEHFGQHKRGNRMWELLLQCWDHDLAARPTAEEVFKLLQNLADEIEPGINSPQ